MLARIHKALDKRDEGFTLIELLVVIIIIGILAAIAIPVFLSQRNKGYDAQAKSDLKNLSTQMETYLNDVGYYPGPTTTTAGTTTAIASNSSGLTWKPSANTGTVKIISVKDNSGTNVAGGGATATGGYCLSAQSQSGKTFYYLSTSGGAGVTSTACT